MTAMLGHFSLNGIRMPAVSGSFYPGQSDALRKTIIQFLAASPGTNFGLRAAVVPHAGYIYSGQIAAYVYRTIQENIKRIRTIALIGPAHRHSVRGVATCNWEKFATPLGHLKINQAVLAKALKLPFVEINNQAHQLEHCLEVQLPFLQVIDDQLQIAPFLSGRSEQQVATLLELICEDDSVLPVISSDLSHYLEYQEAVEVDQATSKAIESLNTEGLNPSCACGLIAIKGLMLYAKKHNLLAKVLYLANSGDLTGLQSEVVGYGAFIFN